MAFDMGFNFRASAGFVTDQAYASPVLFEGYPNTYTNGNGQTINGGLEGTPYGSWAGSLDRAATNDARLAGVNYNSANGTDPRSFRVDLNSGSGLGAASYDIDLAAGDAGDTHNQSVAIYDDLAVLIAVTPFGAPVTTAVGQYLDATGTVISATVAWTGTSVNKTFTSNIARVVFDYDLANVGGSQLDAIAHFRLTQPAGGGGGGAGACECSFFHSFEYREVSDFMDCVVGRRS